jgi:hypothetical protein
MDWEILLLETESKLMDMLADDDKFFEYLYSVDEIKNGSAQ